MGARLLAGAGLCLAALSASGGGTCPQVAELRQLAAGVYVRPGAHGVVFERVAVANLGVVLGRRCAALIDTGGSAAEGRALDCALRRITDKPVCYVINTHVHPDHILGNSAFDRETVRFVGHHRLPREMALLGATYLARARAAEGEEATPVRLVVPDLLVANEMELDLGERRLRLTAHRRAHTGSDLSVWDQDSGTLWLSDLLFVDHVPVIDGSVAGWLQVLEQLTASPVQRVVPGHGDWDRPWPEAAAATLRYLSGLQREVRAFLARGGDLRSAQETVGYGEAGRWLLFEAYHQRNVARVYTELEWE